MVARLQQMLGLGACRANDAAARGHVVAAELGRADDEEQQQEHEEQQQRHHGEWLSPQQAAEHTERSEARHALQLARV